MHMQPLPGHVRRGTRTLPAVLVVMLAAALGMPTGDARAQSVASGVSTLSVAGRSNDAVRLASAGAMVVAVWGASTAGGMDVFSAVSRDGGASFGAPVRVNSTPFDARVGGEQPPQVALVARRGALPTIRVVWTAKHADGGRLRTAQSTDAGVSYSAASDVPGSVATGNRGWESVAATPDGRAFAIWLDHRDLPPMTHTHGSAASGTAPPTPDPAERASYSKLYVASLDGTSPARAIASSVCYCCKTSFVAGADGTLYGVWRHVFPGSLRDMAFTVSRDGGRTFTAPVRVSEDRWSFDGCPDNGPALAVDSLNRVHVVWPSPADARNPNTMALFYAQSRDGTTFSPRVRVPTSGPAGHVTVAMISARELLLVWDEVSHAGRIVRMARVTTDPAGRATFRPITSEPPGKYPAVTLTPTGALVAWTQTQHGRSEIALQRVVR